MTPHIPENVSTWLVNWTLVSNSPPPRDPNDDDEEEQEEKRREEKTKTKRMRTKTKNRRSSESLTNNAAHTPTALAGHGMN